MNLTSNINKKYYEETIDSILKANDELLSKYNKLESEKSQLEEENKNIKNSHNDLKNKYSDLQEKMKMISDKEENLRNKFIEIAQRAETKYENSKKNSICTKLNNATEDEESDYSSDDESDNYEDHTADLYRKTKKNDPEIDLFEALLTGCQVVGQSTLDCLSVIGNGIEEVANGIIAGLGELFKDFDQETTKGIYGPITFIAELSIVLSETLLVMDLIVSIALGVIIFVESLAAPITLVSLGSTVLIAFQICILFDSIVVLENLQTLCKHKGNFTIAPSKVNATSANDFVKKLIKDTIFEPWYQATYEITRDIIIEIAK